MRPVQDVDVLSDDPRTPANRGLVIATAVAVVVIIGDQLTKRWAIETLGAGSCGADPDNCIDVVWTLRFNLVENPGAAFSTGAGLGPLFAAIAAVMTVVLFNAARTRVDRLGPTLLGLIGGGAIGNLIDRMVRAEDGIATGKVIDFIDFQWWPIFNVADMGVVVGVICFIVYSMFEQPPAAESTEAGPDGPDLDDETDPDALAEDLDRALGGGESVDGPDSGDDVNTPDTAGPELDDEVDHEVDAELRAEVGLEAGLDPAEHGPEPGLGAR